MRRLALPAVAVALATLPLPAGAQLFGDAFGDLYLTRDLSADPFDPVDGPSSTCIGDPQLEPFETLGFFLAVRLDFSAIGHPELNASNGFRGWETKIDIPAQLTITSRTLQPPTSINVGDESINNWIVGTGTNILANATPYAVVEYSGLLLAAAQDLVLRLDPSQPSSFPENDGAGSPPGWLEAVPTGDCLNNDNPTECLRPFSRWDLCESTFVINYSEDRTCLLRCAEATESTNWGALKSRF